MNSIDLPKAFLKRMEEVLGEDFPVFMASYECPPEKALRFNLKKVRPETVEALKAAWQLEPVPWCREGYYYREDVIRPGLEPWHDAGVYYIQEPSAMISAARAEIEPGDLVLDLCAAPGGKSTQAAVRAGLLVSNEPIAKRARILSSNIERMGFDRVIVTSAWPDELAKVLPEVFDKVLVDAPCSGEGMMRKDETAVGEWSEANVGLCIERQAEILSAADRMLSPGGLLVYSTCTFEPGENENQIRHFLDLHPDYQPVSMETLYPHQIRGEGHFCAVLKKGGETERPEERLGRLLSGALRKKDRRQRAGSKTDAGYGGRKDPHSSFQEHFEKNSGKAALSCLPVPKELAAYLKQNRIHVLRAGIEPGETRTDRKGGQYYTPSHAEAMARVFAEDGGAKLLLKSKDLALAYLRGETLQLPLPPGPDDAGSASLQGKTPGQTGCGIMADKKLSEPENILTDACFETSDYALYGPEGWLTVYFDRYPLGLGKRVQNTVKNHYPKGLRYQ